MTLGPSQPLPKGDGLWTRNSAPRSESEKGFYAAMNARATTPSAAGVSSGGSAQPQTSFAAGVPPNESAPVAGFLSGGGSLDGAIPSSPHTAQPEFTYFIHEVGRENVPAYVRKDVTSEVMVPNIGHPGQRIVGGEADRDGWVSMGMQGDRGPFIQVGEPPVYNLRTMCDVVCHAEYLNNVVNFGTNVFVESDARVWRRKLDCVTDQYSYVQGNDFPKPNHWEETEK